MFPEALHHCFPQATEMWSMLGDKLALYAFTHAIVGNCPIPYQPADLASGSDEVCAIVTPYGSQHASTSNKPLEGGYKAAVVNFVTISKCTALTDMRMKTAT